MPNSPDYQTDVPTNNSFQDKKWPWVPLLVVLIVVGVIVWRLTAAWYIKLPNKDQTISSAPAIKPSIICPTEKQFCSLFKDIISYGDYIGIGSSEIDENTPLYAVFDGQLMSSVVSNPQGESFWVVYLSNPTEKKQAAYWFKGEEIQPKRVKKGEIIATVSGEPLSNIYQDITFIFTLMDNTTGRILKLEQKDFE